MIKPQEFKSMNDFYDYIEKTPLNDVFRWVELSSVNGGYSFTHTNSFEESVNLFKNGWDQMAKKMEQKLKIALKDISPKTTKRSNYDVTGFQASVPRYLQGIPTNMINKKTVVQKQKVITLNKDISYPGYTSTEEILEYSMNALMIIHKLESQGYRVNLNIILGSKNENENAFIKIRIKSANERLNISKLAFPLVNPSMLRRLLFRYIEVNPEITKNSWKHGYGLPYAEMELQQQKETLLPRVIRNADIDKIIKKII